MDSFQSSSSSGAQSLVMDSSGRQGVRQWESHAPQLWQAEDDDEVTSSARDSPRTSMLQRQATQVGIVHHVAFKTSSGQSSDVASCTALASCAAVWWPCFAWPGWLQI